jgi:hypothetical protein
MYEEVEDCGGMKKVLRNKDTVMQVMVLSGRILINDPSLYHSLQFSWESGEAGK